MTNETFRARVKPLVWLQVFNPEWGMHYEVAEIRFGGHYRLNAYQGYGDTKKYSAAYYNGYGYEFLFGTDNDHRNETYVYGEALAKEAVQHHYEERVKYLLEIEEER